LHAYATTHRAPQQLQQVPRPGPAASWLHMQMPALQLVVLYTFIASPWHKEQRVMVTSCSPLIMCTCPGTNIRSGGRCLVDTLPHGTAVCTDRTQRLAYRNKSHSGRGSVRCSGRRGNLQRPRVRGAIDRDRSSNTGTAPPQSALTTLPEFTFDSWVVSTQTWLMQPAPVARVPRRHEGTHTAAVSAGHAANYCSRDQDR